MNRTPQPSGRCTIPGHHPIEPARRQARHSHRPCHRPDRAGSRCRIQLARSKGSLERAWRRGSRSHPRVRRNGRAVGGCPPALSAPARRHAYHPGSRRHGRTCRGRARGAVDDAGTHCRTTDRLRPWVKEGHTPLSAFSIPRRLLFPLLAGTCSQWGGCAGSWRLCVTQIRACVSTPSAWARATMASRCAASSCLSRARIQQ